MNFIKRSAIWIVRIIAVIVVTAAIGTVLPRPFFSSTRESSTSTEEILLLSNTIHTDLAIPLDPETRQRFSWLALGGAKASGIDIHNPDAGYLIIGWGGEGFYLETPTWADLKPLPVIKAFTLDNSVMHVDLARVTLEDNPAVQKLKMDASARRKLLDFIESSFRKEQGQPRMFLGKAFGQTDRFFEANGYFNAMTGCNTWTAAALREAGFKTGVWNPLPLSLRTSLALFNRIPE